MCGHIIISPEKCRGLRSCLLAYVRPGHVPGLLEIADQNRGKADVRKVANGIEADLIILPSILGAAEILGLIARLEGKILLTDSGTKMLRA